MPELPEVETIVRDLRSVVVGRTIEKASIRLGKMAPAGPRRTARMLQGKSIVSVDRRGKYILIRLTAETRLVVHLKMTGQFLIGPSSTQWPNHVHARFDLDDGQTLMYKDTRQFGRLYAFSEARFQSWLDERNLGPEPFDLTPERFARLLRRRRGRIKSLLLNQSFLAGLGNIYTDEALFAAGINPNEPADRVPLELAEKLHRRIVCILEEAIEARGSTTRDYVGLRGIGGRYQNRHQVYGRGGDSCPICHGTIERTVIGGRSSCFCACCQPLTPASGLSDR